MTLHASQIPRAMPPRASIEPPMHVAISPPACAPCVSASRAAYAPLSCAPCVSAARAASRASYVPPSCSACAPTAQSPRADSPSRASIAPPSRVAIVPPSRVATLPPSRAPCASSSRAAYVPPSCSAYVPPAQSTAVYPDVIEATEVDDEDYEMSLDIADAIEGARVTRSGKQQEALAPWRGAYI